MYGIIWYYKLGLVARAIIPLITLYLFILTYIIRYIINGLRRLLRAHDRRTDMKNSFIGYVSQTYRHKKCVEVFLVKIFERERASDEMKI